MNWTQVGNELRDLVLDSNEGTLIAIEEAYAILLDDPKYFGCDGWAADMPLDPPAELFAAYYAGFAEVQ
jgi:hypothetical protein